MGQDVPGDSPTDFLKLRCCAEKVLRERHQDSGTGLGEMRPEDIYRLVHELRVHQVELEMQNEELRRAELELETSRAEYFDLYDLAPVGYLTVDEAGIIQKANLTAARLLGIERSALVKQPFTRFIATEDQDAYYLHRKVVSKTSAQQGLEARLDRVDGARFWAQLEVAPADHGDGKPLTRIVVMDITERKHAQESLTAAIEELQQADRRKDHFLGVLSHEIRNPLASIVLCLDLLDRSDSNREQAKVREVMKRQAAKLSRLVDDLLNVTRIIQGKIELRKQRVDLGELVRRTAEDCAASFREKGVELQVLPISAGLCVEGDPTRLAQVVGNLLDNAAKFSARDGTTHLDVFRDAGGRCAVIQVADYGIGMAPETLKDLFIPFHQADTSLGRQDVGLGLGLALVKELVELHGGEVRAESRGLGKGSVFTVSLPLSTAEPPLVKPQPDLGVPFPGLRVMVIEDIDDLAESLRILLSAEGFEVMVAHSGLDGIAKAKQSPPDVLICDIGLPDIDGYEVAHTFRSDEDLKRVHLVSLSGYTQPEDRQRGMEAGFHQQLGKPVELRLLRAVLANAQSALRGTLSTSVAQ